MKLDSPVQQFLADNPNISPILEEAGKRATEYFPGSTLTLEEDAWGRLKSFDREWWLDKSAQAAGKLVINIAFL